MIVNPNQTALDFTFDLSGSLAGYVPLLNQLPVGQRVGFDTMPDLLDVSDIGQTWTPEIENLDLDVTLKTYNDEAKKKAPFNTNIKGLQLAIEWGENILPSMFDRDDWITFPVVETEVAKELKHYVNPNQTVVDVSFDLSGSLTGLPFLLDQLPVGERIGFNTIPPIGGDVDDIGQTWTPNIQDQSFVLALTTYNELATQKRPYGTNIAALQTAIDWGNDFLNNVDDAVFAIDDFGNFAIDDFDNFIIT